MPKRSRTGKPDVNQMASNLIDAISGDLPAEQPDSGKNPAAVALGRLGGPKGGKARARKLTAKKRKQIAAKAAAARLTMRMQMRRFTRLTNGFSKKRANHAAAVALHFAHYNLIRVHKTLRMTPAMAHGISDHIWTVGELLERISN